jgi:hypothetical protein
MTSTVVNEGPRPRTPFPSGSLALARSMGHIGPIGTPGWSA